MRTIGFNDITPLFATFLETNIKISFHLGTQLLKAAKLITSFCRGLSKVIIYTSDACHYYHMWHFMWHMKQQEAGICLEDEDADEDAPCR